jgi:hypothetical protein
MGVVVYRGCLQEGVLLPLLWCLVVDDLMARLNRGCVNAQGYADDICPLAVEKFPNTVSGFIQWVCHNVETWCGEIGLLVNSDRTECCIYKKKETSCFF